MSNKLRNTEIGFMMSAAAVLLGTTACSSAIKATPAPSSTFQNAYGEIIRSVCDTKAKVTGPVKVPLPSSVLHPDPKRGIKNVVIDEGSRLDETCFPDMIAMYGPQNTDSDFIEGYHVTYKSGSALFDFVSAGLQSATSLEVACRGKSSHTLEIISEGSNDDKPDSDGTLNVYSDQISMPSEGSDVCADGKVTAADHIQQRRNILFYYG